MLYNKNGMGWVTTRNFIPLHETRSFFFKSCGARGKRWSKASVGSPEKLMSRMQCTGLFDRFDSIETVTRLTQVSTSQIHGEGVKR
jgi:hypothetical protein